MRHALSAVGVLLALSTTGSAQTAAGGPKFDAAEVHLRVHSASGSPGASGGVLRGGRYDLRNATMVDLIAMAYSINNPEMIVGGPNWLERDRFDIAAKAPDGTSPDNVKLMLQQLLGERFTLVLHKDTKPVPGYVLTTGKGPHKMKEASGAGAGCQPNPTPQGGVPILSGSCKGVTMDAFAQLLRGIGGPYITSPVTDKTGLKGYWDFDIHFTPRVALALAGSDAITVFDAVEQQLGLKLDQQNVATPVVVVDSVNQTPAANPSGVAATIPSPPPMEFDVAELKLSGPEVQQPRLRLMSGGRIEGEGITMRQLLQIAWDINLDEQIANAPKWFDETKITLIAKTSTAVSGSGTNMNADIDDLKAMVRALVTERFKLKSHYEDRPVTAYTLLAEKPKMAKADPSNRTGFREGPAPDSKDQRTAILGRMLTIKNMTMAQFAEDLQRFANGYIRVPVEDTTGLDGLYDFTLTFTPIGMLNAGRGRGDAPAGPASADAADPTGAVSLFDAVKQQLGLKLEMRKRPMPVLVIDSIQDKPTDN